MNQGGDREEFEELAQAYEVLDDSLLLAIYDSFGEDALKEGAGGYEPNAVLMNSLERRYKGASQKLDFCSKCKGTGETIDDKDWFQQCEGEKFKELAQAYDVLGDPVQGVYDHYTPCTGSPRTSYDHYGEDALKERLGGGGGVHEPNVVLPLMVSLECMYNGASHKLPVFNYVICSKCKGTGETIDDKDCCQQCEGEKVVKETKVFEVCVEKGMQHGQMITFPGDDHITGEFAFILKQEEHSKFMRNGDDLFVKHTLSLTEALCGFQFELTHLDNRQVIIKFQPFEVIKPGGEIIEINDEGMPMYQKPFKRGKLYIHFTVQFPGSLTPDQSKAIEAALLPRSSPQLTDMEVETATSPRGV